MKRLSVELMLERQNPKQIVAISPDETVTKAAQMMKSQGVGLLIVQVKDDLVGVLSERDIMTRWVCGSAFPKEVKVGDIMSKNVEVVTTNDTIKDCYFRFIARNCRHLPVLDPMGRIAGVLSLRDVSNYVIARLTELED